MSNLGRKNEALLKEIREDFDYFVRFWKETREEGDTDMRYVSGDPWDPKEKKLRDAADRPCVVFDELNQYLNQLINDVRQNKRSVKVDPTGSGATDKTAEFRGNLIRQVEYASKAQAVYATVMENVAQRSYGYARVSKRYVAPDSFDQELVIGAINNPNSVWDDPDAKQRGRSDRKKLFIVDMVRLADFKQRWPKAEVKSFSAEMIADLPMWLKDDFVQVAEYWRIESESRTLLSLDVGGGLQVFEDELPSAAGDGETVTLAEECDLGDGVIVPKGRHKLLNSRESERLTVMQYITNGVEILEENPQDGTLIPVAGCYGKEKYVDQGAGSKLVIESLVRLARGPFMAYCYAQTTGIELLGMLPKFLLMGYEGQFEGHEEELAQLGRVPIPFVQIKAKTEATGETVLPLPQWNHWEAPLGAVEGMAESYRRAIQSALGMYNASVGRHDSAGESGIAIRRLDDQSSQGSFHFIDNFDGFLEDVGRILDDQIDYTYDTVRDVATRTQGDKHKVVRINEAFTDPETGETYHYKIGSGRHSVSITTGPSSQSQRDEASKFADALAQNQQVFPRIADLVVKLKNLGPIGDEIAKRLTPADVAAQEGQGGPPLPPQAQALMAQQKQQLMAQAAVIAELKQQLDAKMPEIQSKQAIAAMVEETKRMEIQAQIRIAELNAGLKASIVGLEQQVAAIQHSIEMQDAQALREHEAGLAALSTPAPAVGAAPVPATAP
jgi:hypothetical protein